MLRLWARPPAHLAAVRAHPVRYLRRLRPPPRAAAQAEAAPAAACSYDAGRDVAAERGRGDAADAGAAAPPEKGAGVLEGGEADDESGGAALDSWGAEEGSAAGEADDGSGGALDPWELVALEALTTSSDPAAAGARCDVPTLVTMEDLEGCSQVEFCESLSAVPHEQQRPEDLSVPAIAQVLLEEMAEVRPCGGGGGAAAGCPRAPQDVVVLGLDPDSRHYAEYLIIATAKSRRHLHAMGARMHTEIKQLGGRPVRALRSRAAAVADTRPRSPSGSSRGARTSTGPSR